MQTVPFSVMVKNLYKTTGYYEDFSSVVHAAIGISGEVQELADSLSHLNTVEEAGDLEFYCEAAIQVLDDLRFATGIDFRVMVAEAEERVTSQRPRLGHMLLRDMQTYSADFLDLSKKLWVYGKPLDGDMVAKLATALGEVRGNLCNFYAVTGLSRTEVIASNQRKLGMRYPEGVYQDAAAQARADKPGEVERKNPDDSEGGTYD